MCYWTNLCHALCLHSIKKISFTFEWRMTCKPICTSNNVNTKIFNAETNEKLRILMMCNSYCGHCKERQNCWNMNQDDRHAGDRLAWPKCHITIFWIQVQMKCFWRVLQGVFSALRGLINWPHCMKNDWKTCIAFYS